MCVFQIEPFAFQAAKQRLYLPTLAVCFNPLALFVTANHQQLPVSQTGSLKIVLLPIQHHRPQSFPFTCFQRPKVALQRPPCATFYRYLRVFLAADAVRNPCLTQIRQPFIVNEFPVGIAGFYMDFGKGLTGKFQQNYSFACVGVPFLSSVSHSSGIATPRQTMASTRMLIQDLPYSHVVRSRVMRTFCQLKTGNAFFARTLPNGRDRHTRDFYLIFYITIYMDSFLAFSG